MKKNFTILFVFLALILLAAQSVSAAQNSLVIPTFTIKSVEVDSSVTIVAKNFPKNESFKVRMNTFGTLGIGGVVVETQDSGDGSFTATYSIPNSLKGLSKIAIRLQSTDSGYYSYNWFWNDTSTDFGTGGPTTSWGYPPKGAGTTPSTTVTNVTEGTDVTVNGTNFTTDDTYNVYIGKYGTKGKGGTKVATQDTNANGKFEDTYDIPAALKDEAKLAIRFESPSSGYYAYDWFYNDTSGDFGTGGPTSSWGYPPKGANTIPSITITEIDKNNTVKIKGTNFTTNDTYKVYMGVFGTKGVGGVKVATQDTNDSGTFTATFDIPASLQGEATIAIRLESANSGYYVYDWFTNKDYP